MAQALSSHKLLHIIYAIGYSDINFRHVKSRWLEISKKLCSILLILEKHAQRQFMFLWRRWQWWTAHQGFKWFDKYPLTIVESQNSNTCIREGKETFSQNPASHIHQLSLKQLDNISSEHSLHYFCSKFRFSHQIKYDTLLFMALIFETFTRHLLVIF